MIDRRGFLSSFAGVAGATGALGLSPKWHELLEQEAPQLPDSALYGSNEEAYWTELRKQFLIPADEVYLNNGTVGSSPMPVLRAVFDGYNETEKMAQSDPEDYPIWGYGSWNEFRDPLAEFIGCTRDELALVRNATEANSYIANGLDMKPVPNAAAVLNLFNDAITPRTRLMFFSHIPTVTGVVLPAKELCGLARSKGILSAVDGAHVVGMMRLNVHELGCDMYSSSPHKWLQAPKGSGFLYVRDEVIDRLWNTIVTAGWDEPKLRAERFQRIGSSNVPALWGLRAAVQLANQIGLERIERRHRQMADYILKEMVQRGAESWTSPDPALRCAIAAVNVAPIQITEIENWMWKNKKIRIRGGAPSKIRLSTPYYLLRKDVDRYLAAFDEYKKGKIAA
jgi:selenocysteine lyase/cysteine desulfurase